MNGFLRRHWIAIMSAAIVGIIVIAPHLRWSIYPMGSDAESHYLARIQEVYDGNGWGNPFLNDARSTEYSPYLSFAEYILAYPGKTLGISTPKMNLVYKALLPAIIFLLIYALFLKFRNDRAWGIFAGLCVVLGYQVFTLHGLLDLGSGSNQFILYSRPVNPQLSSIFLFAYLLIAYSVFRQYRRRDMIILAALFGLSFYIYFYLWTWLLMLQGVLVALALFRKRFAEAGWWLAISGVGLVIGSPFLLHLWRVMQSPLYAFFSATMDVVRGHAIHASLLGIVVSVLFLYRMIRCPRETREWFLLGLLATTWLAIDQQVITGIALQYGHYHWYYNMPVYVIILFVLASDIPVLLYRRLAYLGGAALALLSVISGIVVQVSSYRFWAPTMAAIQRYEPALRWLDEHTPRNSVVLSNEMLSELIPVYTHDDVFWNPYAVFYLLPSGLVDQTLYTYMKLNGVRPRVVSGDFYYAIKNANVQDTQIQELMKPQYRPFLSGLSSVEYGKVYAARTLDPLRKIDYLLVDTEKDAWKIGNMPGLQKVFMGGGVTIYALHE